MYIRSIGLIMLQSLELSYDFDYPLPYEESPDLWAIDAEANGLLPQQTIPADITSIVKS